MKMMSRKHFREIAEILNSLVSLSDYQKSFLVTQFSGLCERDNPNFDREKFKEACYKGERK